MKTTIYELLGMIKDDNIPQRIIFKDQIYEYVESAEDYYNEEHGYIFDVYVLKSILNEEVEILDNIENTKQEETPMFKKVDGEWYINKEMIKWLDKQCLSTLNNKQDKIEKINIEDLAEPTNENNIRFNFAEITDKINEIIDRLNKDQL